jgi:hypothetical protein
MAIVVGRAGKTGRRQLSSAIERLEQVGTDVAGSVLNDIDSKTDGYYYSYYHTENNEAPARGRRARGRDTAEPGPQEVQPASSWETSGPKPAPRPAPLTGSDQPRPQNPSERARPSADSAQARPPADSAPARPPAGPPPEGPLNGRDVASDGEDAPLFEQRPRP